MLRKSVVRGKGVVPFAALFVERGVVVPHEPPPYSESEQRGMIGDPGKINPLYMSPTSIGTSSGDHIGDESC